MIPNNMPELQVAFDSWVDKGSYELPTVKQQIERGQVDVELLHQLAKFIWMQAGGYVSPEACQDIFEAAGVRVGQPPSEALHLLAKAGILTETGDLPENYK